ncbi:MAG: hypothetical protein V3U17_04350, partial [Thermoplasmata archaeon]
YEIVYENLPADPRLLASNEAHQRESLLFHGGDFELVFTCRPEHWADLAEEFERKKVQATPIGQVRGAGENRLRFAGEVETLDARGYEHFT